MAKLNHIFAHKPDGYNPLLRRLPALLLAALGITTPPKRAVSDGGRICLLLNGRSENS